MPVRDGTPSDILPCAPATWWAGARAHVLGTGASGL